MKLALFDLDGTLFDTKDVNYHAYNEALNKYGFSIDYDYYCRFCNGRRYTDFLPQIVGDDERLLKDLHNDKKLLYSKHLSKAKINQPLFDLIDLLKAKHKVAIVTTASLKNCTEILKAFKKDDLFDLIITQEDIKTPKPDPEGFLLAMKHFNVKPGETVIFEDSTVGLEAAKRSGAYYYKTYGFN